MSIDRKDIERIAHLARLQLDEDESESLRRECDRVLRYFEALREVDEPETAAAGEGPDAAPQRDDRVDPDPLHRSPEQMAPAWLKGFFVLPRLPALDDRIEPGPSREDA